MLTFYEELRKRIKTPGKQFNKNNHIQQETKKKINNFKNNYKTEKESYSNLNKINNNIKKSNSFYISKKIQELKNIQNIKNLKKENNLEFNKKYHNKKQNKQFYNFQNFYNNYPMPEPLPKKIDIKIINNNSNFNTSNINDSSINFKPRNSKSIYDDKKILFILSNLGLEELFCKFKDNFITYNDLNFLTKEDFIEMNIPIGPRNRIIHFIQELKKNGINLDFEGLKDFIEKYKKIISGQKANIKNENNNSSIKIEDKSISNNKYPDDKKLQNSFIFSSQYESEKNDNISFFDRYKNNISFLSNNINCNNNFNSSNKNILDDYSNSINNNNKPNLDMNQKKFYSENNLPKFSYFSENKKENKLYRNIYNNYELKINNIHTPNNIINKGIKDKKLIFNNKRSYSQKTLNNKNNKFNNKKEKEKDNYNLKTHFNFNYDYIKVPHFKRNYSNFCKYNEFIPEIKKKKNYNIKEKNKNNVLRRNNTYSNNKFRNTKVELLKNENESYNSNIFNLSKDLLNRLNIINKEVEIYQHNYERLKNETKRRNKNVKHILSCNFLKFKKNPNLERNFNNFNNYRNIVYVHNKDLQNEKERNLKIELNSFNYKISNIPSPSKDKY